MICLALGFIEGTTIFLEIPRVAYGRLELALYRITVSIHHGPGAVKLVDLTESWKVTGDL